MSGVEGVRVQGQQHRSGRWTFVGPGETPSMGGAYGQWFREPVAAALVEVERTARKVMLGGSVIEIKLALDALDAARAQEPS